MALISWTDRYSVDVELFDNHHKKLIGLINQLHQAMSDGSASNIIKDILDKLVIYTDKHFKAEEELMQKYSYPEYLSHHGLHKKLIDQVTKLQSDVNSGKLTVTIQTMNFLSDWLQTHIMQEDKKYGGFFNANGIK